MPNQERFDWEKIKTDPRLWMRLAMPQEKGDKLENVFKDKENPFEKGGTEALNKVKKLAEDGKLYIRESGRSRHFRKAEIDQDGVKLGDQKEVKLSNNNTGLVMSMLLWATKRLFQWWGWNFVANRIEKALERRRTINALEDEYKKEYKNFTSDQKDELKNTRQQEKLRKKLEEQHRKLEETQMKLNELQGNNKEKQLGENPSPLSTPPVQEQTSTMQPTFTGDPKLQNQQNTKQDTGVQQQQTTNQQQTLDNGTNTVPKKDAGDDKTVLNGKEYTQENIRELPEGVQAALQAFKMMAEQWQAMAQQMNNQMQNLLSMQQQMNQAMQNQQQMNQPMQNQQPVPEVKKPDQFVQQQVETIQFSNQNEQAQPANTEVIQETVPPEALTNPPNAQAEAPLADPPIEPQNIPIQPQPQPQQEDRLAMEKAGMDAAKNWRDTVTLALLVNTDCANEIEQMPTLGGDNSVATSLRGITCGVLSQKNISTEVKQQVLDALLNGKPLGQEHSQVIRDGIEAYKDAANRFNENDKGPLSEMLADTVRELSDQAGRESGLTSRLMMNTRLISGIFKVAQDKGLNLPLNEGEMQRAQGATEMGLLAEDYLSARQYLGSEKRDLNTPESTEAVRNLLAGNAVDKMMLSDKQDPEINLRTYLYMSSGLWSAENLKTMVTQSETKRLLGADHITAILEKPEGFRANCVAKDLGAELVVGAMGIFAQRNQQPEPQLQIQEQQINEQLEQPQIANPFQAH